MSQPDPASSHIVRFSHFELDLRSGELSSNGRRRTLPEQPLQILRVLLDRPGELVTRDELRERLWPADTFVDFEHGLNAAVKRLRDALGDSADVPRLIETVPRRGYRFIAPVSHVDRELAVNRESESPSAPPRRRARAAAISITGVCAITAAAWWFWPRPLPPAASQVVVPLTTLKGVEVYPTLSPDGEQVAFDWDGNTGDNRDIYLKTIGASEVRRLTTSPHRDTYPAWSPDGRQIAFARIRDPLAAVQTVYLVSPLTGAERKIIDFPINGRVAWTPDGKWLAVGRNPGRTNAFPPSSPGNGGIYLIPVQGGEPRALTTIKGPHSHFNPALSPDGRRVAYIACRATASCNIEVAALDANVGVTGSALPLVEREKSISGLAWDPEGRSIVYAVEPAPPASYLWRVRADGRRTPERLEVAGIGALMPGIALRRDRLAFALLRNAVSIHALDSTHSSPGVLISTFWDWHPSYSPDGTLIAFSSSRSADAVEIWLSGADGSAPRQLTHGPGQWQGSPAWSPDGWRIAFDSRHGDGTWSIWTIDVEGGSPRQVTREGGDENMPGWSHDGRWIYFVSDQGRGRDVWRIPADGGTPERITRAGCGLVYPFESVDGRELLYKAVNGESPLLALPLSGGTPRAVVPCATDTFTVAGERIYYAECGRGPERALRVRDTATGQDRALGKVRDIPTNTWARPAVSPDGHTILIHRNTVTSDLMLIEHFR
jgi:Tol biopolymer transport system component/DNA-binding winged helix-turn-helix (wHTH) protein